MKRIFVSLFVFATSLAANAQGMEEGLYQGAYFSKKLQKVLSAEMGYHKSLYYRLNRNVILGGGTSLKAVRSMREAGTQNVVLEARGTIHPQYPARVNFGPYGGGVEFGFTNLISAVHSAGMNVTLKLRLVEPDGETSASKLAPDSEVFWDSYLRFAQRFAKIAQGSSVAEVVLATGLTRQICALGGRPAIVRLVDTVRYYYTGRIRLDVESVHELPDLLNCIGDQFQHFDSFGFEVPSASTAQVVLKDFEFAAGLLAGTGKILVSSGLRFEGLNQAEKFRRFFEELDSLIGARNLNLTLGLVDVNPDKISPTDESVGILGKPTLEVIKAWFAEN